MISNDTKIPTRLFLLPLNASTKRHYIMLLYHCKTKWSGNIEELRHVMGEFKFADLRNLLRHLESLQKYNLISFLKTKPDNLRNIYHITIYPVNDYPTIQISNAVLANNNLNSLTKWTYILFEKVGNWRGTRKELEKLLQINLRSDENVDNLLTMLQQHDLIVYQKIECKPRKSLWNISIRHQIE